MHTVSGTNKNLTLELLKNMLSGEREYGELAENLSAFSRGGKAFRQGAAYASGLCDTLRALLFCMLAGDEKVSGKGKTSLVLVPDEKTAFKYRKMLCAMTDGVYVFPQRDFVLHNVNAASREFEHERMLVLKRILDGSANIVIAVPQAALGVVPSPEDMQRSVTIKSGTEISVESLAEELICYGYSAADSVEGKGQFARRGDIFDVFPPAEDSPIRIEFFGDEVDTVNHFDLMTQRRTESVDSIEITPTRELLLSGEDMEKIDREISELIAKLVKKRETVRTKDVIKSTDMRDAADRLRGEREAISLGNLPCTDKYLAMLGKNTHSLFDYIDGAIFAVELPDIKNTIKNALWQLSESMLGLYENGEAASGSADLMRDFEFLADCITKHPTVICDTFTADTGVSLSGLFSFVSKDIGSFTDSTDILVEDLETYTENGYTTVIMTGSAHSAAVLSATLSERFEGTDVKPVCVSAGEICGKTLSNGVVYIVAADAGDSTAKNDKNLAVLPGFELRRSKIAVLSEGSSNDVNGKRKRRSSYSSKGKAGAKRILSYADLSVGDYVVHSAHGIGRYEGLRTLTSDGKTRDYITLTYDRGDTVYVPADQLDRVSKYAGGSETVKLSRLGSKDWEKTKTRVKTAAKNMAKELIELYASRARLPGYAFNPDGEWQKDFEARFPYEETDGQLEASAEIKKDMEKNCPMDRILCGDVGFGKTEVALRAMFKCVSEGKQAAILVPTTILAWQHFRTILSRMQGFPVNVEMISRFRSAKQIKEILKKLKSGELDIIVGTHRLLSKDVEFKDLGLLVVDEEQRFGVSHKEKLKQMTKCVDVLTLSATPIPRTLNMAMAGIRDMSVLEEAPQDRYPVQTYVLEYDREIIMDAIRKELRRGGQVFYLRNIIEGIESVAAEIKAAVPDAEVAIAHGKMTEEELSDIWKGLVDGDIDVLVCTTIIETGVDVPNANTLIIENADRMGLSQLHQIRGRVGRSNRRAYAYLTWKRGAVLAEVAKKRLDAIREYTEFGSGFKIAMRDLEIRGAGNLLGAEQSGHMEAVGYDLYIRLLEEAVLEEKGIAVKKEPDCAVELGMNAYIPESYIKSLPSRIDAYKRIAAISDDEGVSDVIDELCDRYGNPPQCVENLVKISSVRVKGTACGFSRIELSGNNLKLFPRVAADKASFGKMLTVFKGKVLYTAGVTPHFTIKLSGAGELNEALDKIFTLYTQKEE